MTLNKSTIRFVVLMVAAVMALTVLVPVASFASSEGRRNTTIGLAGAAAYLLLNGKTVPGIAAAAGAAYSYSRYKDARDNERYNDRYWNSRYYNSRDRDRYSYNRDWNRYDNDRYGRGRSTWDDRDRYDRDRGQGKEHWNRGKHLGWDKNNHDRDRDRDRHHDRDWDRR